MRHRPSTVRFIVVVLDFYLRQGKPFPVVQTLIEETGFSRKTVVSVIRSLKNLGSREKLAGFVQHEVAEFYDKEGYQ